MKLNSCAETPSTWTVMAERFSMTKSAIFLLLSACLLLSVKGYAQNVSISEKNTPLAQVFDELRKQTGYTFFYKDASVKDIRVSVSIKDVQLDKALNIILENQPLVFSIIDKTVVLKRKTENPKTIPNAVSPVQVKGKVVDESGGPIVGATVSVKGTKTISATDASGNFAIAAPENAVLVVSYLGYQTQEYQNVEGNAIVIKMVPTPKNLDEVVVVGYGTQKKSDVTGSIVRADLESFRTSPNSNIAQLLQGAVPGLNVGPVTSAGQTPSIQVRGQSTLSGSQGVLIVLDGIVYAGDLSRINPNDIASVDVLKDASSKAIYGATAANGVLLITTKKGKIGSKPIINFSSSYATQDPANILHPLNREQFIQKVRDINWRTAYLAPEYIMPNPTFNVRSALDPTQQAGYDNGTDFDWYGAATNSGFLYDQQVSISNATEKTNFFLSGGYTKQKGFIINNQFNRKSVRLNLETKVFDWLTVGTNAFASFADYSGLSPNLRDIMLYSPLNTPYDAAGNIILTPNASINNPFLATLGNNYDRRNNLSGNFYGILNLPFIPGLSYRINYGNNYFWNQNYSANQYSANFTGAASKTNDNTYDSTIDHILSYKRTLDNIHSLDLTMVYGSRSTGYQTTNANGTGYNNIILGYNKLDQATIQKISSGAYSETYNYQTARLSYGFRQKYILTSTVRRDGFSGFASNNKWGIFPSAAFAWVASNESFMRFSWLNNLKMRIGYGANGNLTNRYASLATVGQGAAYVFGDGGTTLFGQVVNSMGNNDLSWEKTVGINTGLDFSILKGRISGSVDYYNTITSNLLYNINIPEITGFSSIPSNVGRIRNSGTEINVNTVNLKLENFQWNSVINFATNKNRIKELLGTGDLVASNLFVDRSIGTIYNYQTNGLWQLGETPPSGYAVGSNKLVDLNGDGKIDASDRTFLGYTEPAYRVSFGNTFSYKNISLFVFLNAVQGGKNGYMNANNPWTDLGIQQGDNAIRNNWFKEIDYWTPSNPGAQYRITGTVPAVDPQLYQQRNFIRLQEVSLRYNFDSRITKKLGLNSLQVFVSGKNLALWTKWRGWDPETLQGLAYGASPIIRGYSAGLNVTF